MARIPLYWVDAFADSVGQGNPAAVCPLSDWLPDSTLQEIAAENGLSETAFFLRNRDPMPLRWFTPREEVALCGHATLAAGFAVLEFVSPELESVRFATKSGEVSVSRSADGFTLDLPVVTMSRLDNAPPALIKGLSHSPSEVWQTEHDYIVILKGQSEVAQAEVDLSYLEGLHPFGVAISAPCDEVDFVSRYFAPSYGIAEDPVTGSIHCALGPYWEERLGREVLNAIQLSSRGGRLRIQRKGDRIHLTGRVACYLTGAICCTPDGACESTR